MKSDNFISKALLIILLMKGYPNVGTILYTCKCLLVLQNVGNATKPQCTAVDGTPHELSSFPYNELQCINPLKIACNCIVPGKNGVNVGQTTQSARPIPCMLSYKSRGLMFKLEPNLPKALLAGFQP